MLKRVTFLFFVFGLMAASFVFIGAARAQENNSEEITIDAALPVSDADRDGYEDGAEIEKGYSPFNPEAVKIEKSDVDKDGVSDYFELKFKTDPLSADTDKDGYSDFQEIDGAFDPLSTSTKKLAQKVEIKLKEQKLFYFVGGHKWREFTISSGKASMPTPSGEFKVTSKIKKAWSKRYGLWMPFWLGLDRGGIGIHELPVWPSGYREGEDHLGKPVSHGCVRLGVGPAQYLFDRVDIGLKVSIVK